MREKKSTRFGRRTGLEINYKQHSKSSDDDDTTNLDTGSEMQVHTCNLNFSSRNSSPKRSAAEQDDGLGETFSSSKAPRSSNPDSCSFQLKKSASQNEYKADDGIEMPPVSDIESEFKKSLRPRLKRASGSILNDLVENTTSSSAKRKLNFSTLRKDATRGEKMFSPPQQVNLDESNCLPKPKIQKKNKSKQVPTPYLQGRPQRNRIRPLAFWKGEYRLFRYTKDGDMVLAEMNLGDSPSPVRKKKPAKKKQLIAADDVISDQKQLRLNDKELVEVHQELNWWAINPGCKFAHSIITEDFVCGSLELDINGSKEEKCSPKLSLKFIVMEGIVKFTLLDEDGGEMRVVRVGRKNTICIPRMIPYSIKNCYAAKSLLYYHSISDL